MNNHSFMPRNKNEFYESPQMEVFETKVRGVLSASGNQPNNYPGYSWD